MATEQFSDEIHVIEDTPSELIGYEIGERLGEDRESLLEIPKQRIDDDEPMEPVEEVKPELTEEEKAALAIRNEEIARKREEEINRLYELGDKFTPGEVSDIKIHIMIEVADWKKAMNGHELMVYLEELSKRDPKPSMYNIGKLEYPPEFTAKTIGRYLFRLGKYFIIS